MPTDLSQQDFLNELTNYAKKLKEDLDSKKPRVYAPVVWAYQNEQVCEAISLRLAAGQVLISSVQIVPDRALRRERVFFDFAPQGRFDAKLPGILVQINDDNSVAEIVDPFDILAGDDITTANASDTLSLFASKTSNSDQLVNKDSQAESQMNARWTRFVSQPELARMAGRGFGGFGGFGGLGGFGFGPFSPTDTICGGVPTLSSVMSSTGSKEDPDQDTQGGQFDDSGPSFF